MIESYYRDELRWLHESGRTFARAHPDAARWLAEPGSDPDVERLLEGAAFLSARLRQRAASVDDEVAQGLCAALLPTALRPLPALAVVRFSGQRDLRECERVPAGTPLDSVAVDGEPCRFHLAWEVQVPPVTVSAIELHPGDFPRLEVHLALAPGAVPARLGPQLRLHACGEAPLARALIRALASPRSLQAVTAGGRIVPLTVAWYGPGVAPPVLPGDPGLARGHAILAEALAWPELSRFVELSGPVGFGVEAGERGLRLVAELDRLPTELRGAGPDDLLLGCAPAINLWPAEADPLLVDGTWRERDLLVGGHPGAEVWAVRGVRGSGQGRPARIWPQAAAAVAGGPCWQELRRPAGVQLAIGPLDREAEREVLAIDVLAHDAQRCLRLGAGDLRVPTIAVPGSLTLRNLAPPARALDAPQGAGRVQQIARRLRLAATGVRSADDLRQLLDLHDRRGEAEAAGRSGHLRLAGAVLDLAQQHAAVPLGATAARAWISELELDEQRLGGAAGAWLLGSVLDRALATLAPLGTVTALRARCRTSGEQLSWPARCAGATA